MSRRASRKHQRLSPEALGLVALSDPTRLAILQELFEGELSVSEICERTGASQANASKHLSTLATEGILARRKAGLFVYYSIVDDTIRSLCEVVCGSLSERFSRAGSHFA